MKKILALLILLLLFAQGIQATVLGDSGGNVFFAWQEPEKKYFENNILELTNRYKPINYFSQKTIVPNTTTQITKTI